MYMQLKFIVTIREPKTNSENQKPIKSENQKPNQQTKNQIREPNQIWSRSQKPNQKPKTKSENLKPNQRTKSENKKPYQRIKNQESENRPHSILLFLPFLSLILHTYTVSMYVQRSGIKSFPPMPPQADCVILTKLVSASAFIEPSLHQLDFFSEIFLWRYYIGVFVLLLLHCFL